MSGNVALQIKPSFSKLIETLDPIPRISADVCRPLFHKATIENYRHLMYMMYHYTLDSENKLKFTANHADTEELKRYFLEMAKEERGHYVLAEVDLEACGIFEFSKETPASVKEFNELWYEFGQYEDSNRWLGALYVYENIARYLIDDVGQMIKRLQLTKQQTRWLNIHSEADDEHGNEALEMCLKYAPINEDAIIDGATRAVKACTKVFKQALEGLLPIK